MKKIKNSARTLLSLLAGLAILIISFTNLPLSTTANQISQPAELEGVLRSDFKTIQTFKLIDQHNDLFNETRLKDKWSFVFFGYTSCPDVCPTTLTVLNSVNTLLEQEGITNMQAVFISVDPKRDTTELLSSYVAFFNKDFIGTTGSKIEIDAVNKFFGADYEYEPETDSGQYLVSHTSAIFLVDTQGRLVATFSQPHYPTTIAAQFKKIHSFFNNES